ncbi:MAG: TIGR02611 family protein [Leucobacter sp.]
MTTPEDDAARAHRLARPVAQFMHRWRQAIRKRPWLDIVYRVIITTLGVLIAVIGLILVPLPGPGWLIVFIGLTVLGSEYHWARRVLGWLRRVLARFWERWRAWRGSREARREANRQADSARP